MISSRPNVRLARPVPTHYLDNSTGKITEFDLQIMVIIYIDQMVIGLINWAFPKISVTTASLQLTYALLT